MKASPDRIAIDIAGRVPPHNIDAEAVVLSAIMLDGRSLDRLDFLAADHFYAEAHRRIFEAARALHAKGQPIDIATVANWLRDRDWIQAIGGVAYLAKIVDATPAVAHLEAHARIVVEKARIRGYIETSQVGIAEAYGDYGDAQTFLEGAEHKLFELARTEAQANDIGAHDMMVNVLEDVRRSAERGGGITGLPTGFSKLDELTDGMHGGELIIVAARPAVGKTAYALNIALHVAMHGRVEGKVDGKLVHKLAGVHISSLEMPHRQLGPRMVATVAGLDLLSMRKAALTSRESDEMALAAEAIRQLPIWVDDTPSITPMRLRATLRRCQRARERGGQAKLALAVVDYLQLMRGDAKRYGSREEEVASVSRELKSIAKELDIPIIALAQLNRDIEKRAGKARRPQLSDLRESGGIEQDADVVQFLNRPQMAFEPGSDEHAKLAGVAEVVVAKQRNGPTGDVSLTFVEKCTRFVDPFAKGPARHWQEAA